MESGQKMPAHHFIGMKRTTIEGIAGVLMLGAAVLLVSTAYGIPVRLCPVAGHSMEPAITAADLVVVGPVQVNELKVGDIIAFRPQNGGDGKEPYVAHRIVAIDPSGDFRVKGDNLASEDRNPVEPGDVAGRVLFTIPRAGTVMRVASSPVGYLIFILLPGIVLISDELKKLRRCGRCI
jgi:signal peptidase